jgi:hypothetical protein
LSCSASYPILLSIPVLSLAVCPVSCCPSCLLLSVKSLAVRPVSCPVCHPWSILSKKLYPYIQCIIQSWLTFSSFREPIIISLDILAECPVQEVLSCYPVLGILSLVSCAGPAHLFFYFVVVALTVIISIVFFI